MRSTAIYFDGKSAKPVEVEIELDAINNQLLFVSSEFSGKCWPLSIIDFQKLDSCLELIPKGGAGEMLKITDPDIIRVYIGHLRYKGKLSLYHRLLFGGLPTFIAMTVVVIISIIVTWLYVLPPVAENAATLIPEEFDSYLSNQYINDFFLENNVDSIKTMHLNAFASNINFNSDRNYQFYVVNSEMINAYALPDGTIVVFSALLNRMKSSNEMVALLAHEAAHVNKRHSVKMLARNLAGYLFISIVFSDVNGIMAVLAENAEGLNSLSYSRKFEDEADEEGFRIMVKNKINPEGMISLFSRLKDEEKYSVPVFLSTHPVTDVRISKIKELIKTTKANYQSDSKLLNDWNNLVSVKR